MCWSILLEKRQGLQLLVDSKGQANQQTQGSLDLGEGDDIRDEGEVR